MVDQGEWGFDKVKRIAEEGSKASAVASVPPLLKGTLPPGLSAEDMGVDLLSYLTVNRLHAASPVAYRTAVLLGLVTPAADGTPSVPQPDADNIPPVRLPRRRDTIHLDRIIDLLTGPGDHLRAVYLPGGVATQGDADRLASMAFPRIAALLGELGVPARYGISDDIVSALTPAGSRCRATCSPSRARSGWAAVSPCPSARRSPCATGPDRAERPAPWASSSCRDSVSA